MAKNEGRFPNLEAEELVEKLDKLATGKVFAGDPEDLVQLEKDLESGGGSFVKALRQKPKALSFLLSANGNQLATAFVAEAAGLSHALAMEAFQTGRKSPALADLLASLLVNEVGNLERLMAANASEVISVLDIGENNLTT